MSSIALIAYVSRIGLDQPSEKATVDANMIETARQIITIDLDNSLPLVNTIPGVKP